MVGLERTVVPLIGEREFGLTSKTAIVSFIVSFGVTKALLNLVAARLAERVGRKPILVAGWLFGLPVPFMIMWAPSWGWIDAANVLLGANQAFAWSMTVIMKVDLVGPQRRGLALGLNEFAGYLSVALSAWATGYIAEPVRAPARAVLLRRGRRHPGPRLVGAVRPGDARSRRARGRPDRPSARSERARALASGEASPSRPGATGASPPPARRGSSTT